MNTFIRNNREKTTLLAKRLAPVILIIVIAIVGIVAVTRNRTAQADATQSSNETTVKPALKTTELNRQFSFPIGDEEAEENISYEILTAEVREEIVVQGQKARAISGRAFLILNLKITNDLDSPVEINTKDYVRMSVGDSEERLAADIHSDPVTVQAISTKNTRIAFPISKDDIGSIKLHVGQISGDKETIDVVFN